MIEQKTIVDQIEIRRDGTIGVRFAILTLKDGAEIASSWHRTSIAPGDDVDAQIAAVNADITTRQTIMAEPVDETNIPLLKEVAALVHTPDVVSAYQQKKGGFR